jgi:hypothetical protein
MQTVAHELAKHSRKSKFYEIVGDNRLRCLGSTCPKKTSKVDSETHVPAYNSRMMAQLLLDTVAFLQSRYKVECPTARQAYS